ncbi:MAG: tRNA 2-thiouridine(34) synthase MnmA, partial [Spirochaetia bacterium]|nr:tRNA 2-thiouridine(34) synthase MnmA [Spirochaetia bacterium]
SGVKLADIKSAPYFNFTVGQRKGLGYAAGKPKYVVRVDAQNRRVILGSREEAACREFTATGVNVLCPLKKTKFTAMVRVRYRHEKAKAGVEINNGSMKITFHEPQFAVAPGQLAVVYKGGAVAASGFIKA